MRRTRLLTIVVSLSALAVTVATSVTHQNDAQASPALSEYNENPGMNVAFNMHACKRGYAIAAKHGNNFVCRRVTDDDGDDCFVDRYTHRGAAHACPKATYLRGIDEGGDTITCCFPRARGYTVFSGPEVFQDRAGIVPGDVHVCGGTNAASVAVGSTHDTLLCRGIPTVQPPVTDPSTMEFDSQKPRGVRDLRIGTSNFAPWRRGVRNWLARMFDLEPPASDTAPGAPAEGRFVLPVESVPVATGPSDCPAPPGGVPDGVLCHRVSYRSPYDGATIPSYLLLPPGYQATGKYPALVLFHGHSSYGKQGTAVDGSSIYHAGARYFARHGFIALAPDTRSFDEFVVAGEKNGKNGSHSDLTGDALPHVQQYVNDALASVSVLGAVPGVDSERLFAAGLSLGGFIAQWIGAIDARVKGTVVGGNFLPVECMNDQSGGSLTDQRNHRCQAINGLQRRDINGTPPGSTMINADDVAALLVDGQRRFLATFGTAENVINQQMPCVSRANSATIATLLPLGAASRYKWTGFQGMLHEFEAPASLSFLAPEKTPQSFWDHGTADSGMHACPAGHAMLGYTADHSDSDGVGMAELFLCSATERPGEVCRVDPDGGTARQGVHACPAGSWMRGLHRASNRLLCCSDGGRTVLGAETLDARNHLLIDGVHACSDDAHALLTGVHDGKDERLCAAVVRR